MIFRLSPIPSRRSSIASIRSNGSCENLPSPKISDYIRILVAPSAIITFATDMTVKYLHLAGACGIVSDSIVCSVSAIFFSKNSKNLADSTLSIILRHHSPVSVLVYVCNNGRPLGSMVMWSPKLEPWKILYLIGGYFKFPRAIIELHKINRNFCEYDKKTRVCKVCKSKSPDVKNATPGETTKIEYKLTPQYESDEYSDSSPEDG